MLIKFINNLFYESKHKRVYESVDVGVFAAGSDDNVAVIYDGTKLAIIIAIFIAIIFILILICFEVADCCRQALDQLLSRLCNAALYASCQSACPLAEQRYRGYEISQSCPYPQILRGYPYSWISPYP